MHRYPLHVAATIKPRIARESMASSYRPTSELEEIIEIYTSLVPKIERGHFIFSIGVNRSFFSELTPEFNSLVKN